MLPELLIAIKNILFDSVSDGTFFIRYHGPNSLTGLGFFYVELCQFDKPYFY